MSGTYFAASADAPGGLNESVAAVREGLATAYAAYEATARETAAFLVAHGPATIQHAPVGEPGRMGDPDPSLDAADL